MGSQNKTAEHRTSLPPAGPRRNAHQEAARSCLQKPHVRENLPLGCAHPHPPQSQKFGNAVPPLKNSPACPKAQNEFGDQIPIKAPNTPVRPSRIQQHNRTFIPRGLPSGAGICSVWVGVVECGPERAILQRVALRSHGTPGASQLAPRTQGAQSRLCFSHTGSVTGRADSRIAQT